jgi:5-bromo-4-chloroindolyl phosphate hydrolysis protein
MTLTEILLALAVLVAIPTALVALFQVRAAKRDALIKQGAHDQETKTMQENINRLFEKARVQEACTADSNTAIAETRNDIKWIRDSLSEIKSLIAERKGA